MPTLWHKIQEKVKEGSFAAFSKGEEIAKVGRLKMEIAAIHRHIHDRFGELGGLVYHKLKEENAKSVKNDPEIIDVLEKIKNYEIQLHLKEKKLNELENDL